MTLRKTFFLLLWPCALFAQLNTSETKFFFGNETDQQIEVEKDSQGNITKVFYTGDGVKKET